jgi:hypothetical protein
VSLDADPGVQGEACPEYAEWPPPWSHWRISAVASGVISPGPPRAHVSNTVPHCSLRKSSRRPAPPRTSTINAAWTPVAVPHHPPRSTTLGRPSLFPVYCGLAGVHRGSCGLADRPTWPARGRFCSLLGVLHLLVGRVLWRSPQAVEIRPLQNSKLRADGSSGWMGSLAEGSTPPVAYRSRASCRCESMVAGEEGSGLRLGAGSGKTN